MAEKNQTPQPLVANVRSEEEESGFVSTETQDTMKKKRMKCIAFGIVFTIFQIGVILVFVLVVMRFKNPKFRIHYGSFDNDTFEISKNMTALPYFDLTLQAQIGIKNTNFGHFKYEMSNVTFEYRGMVVGVVSIERARTRARSTRKLDARAVLNTKNFQTNASDLRNDIISGKVPITSFSRLDGKIQLMKLIKKKKSAQMNCNMNLDIQTRTLQDIVCQ